MNNDARPKAKKIAGMIGEVMTTLSDDTLNVQEPQAKALFEAAGEVLRGLKRAFEFYQERPQNRISSR